MPPLMRPVYSSGITAVGHDPETNELHVTWSGGRTSVYQNVPPEVAHQTANSWSVGKAMNVIKADPEQFPHRYLDGSDAS